MTENEFLLNDRIAKIQSIVDQWYIEGFYVSFSGGKDSSVLSKLVDLALPGNKIPRVYADTGIELNLIRQFVYDLAKNDDRIVIIKPSVPIKQTLEEKGYPFKSKEHSYFLDHYQTKGMDKVTQHYLTENRGKNKKFRCPDVLKYQFSDEFKLKVSDKCCYEMKEKPLRIWEKENEKPYAMLGIMREEGGRRLNATCVRIAKNSGKLKSFSPLVAVSKDWEEWFIKEYNVPICPIYKPPYNFKRTGCKGCPFNIELQDELNTLQKYFPGEKKQCEIIWEPVYTEYRRIGYRLAYKPDAKVLF